MKLSSRFVTGGWASLLLVAICLTGGLGSAQAQTSATRDLRPQVVLPPTNPPTEVSIVAKVPTAYAAAGIPGSFRLTRTGSLLEDLTVSYQVSGQAVAGKDYKTLKGTKTIPATQSKVQININPLDVPGSGGTVKGVRVTLLPSDGYSISSSAKATVRIVQ